MAIASPEQVKKVGTWTTEPANRLLDEADANPGEWVYLEDLDAREGTNVAMRSGLGRVALLRSYELKTSKQVLYIRLRTVETEAERKR